MGLSFKKFGKWLGKTIPKVGGVVASVATGNVIGAVNQVGSIVGSVIPKKGTKAQGQQIQTTNQGTGALDPHTTTKAAPELGGLAKVLDSIRGGNNGGKPTNVGGSGDGAGGSISDTEQAKQEETKSNIFGFGFLFLIGSFLFSAGKKRGRRW